MVEAARHGRPEITAGCCLTLGLLALWRFIGEGERRPAGPARIQRRVHGRAPVAHLDGVLRSGHRAGVRGAVAAARRAGVTSRPGSRPSSPSLCSTATSFSRINLRTCATRSLPRRETSSCIACYGRSSMATGMCSAASLLEFWRDHARLAVAVAGSSGSPAATRLVVQHPSARGARFFAAIYCLFFAIHFVCLKPLVPSYRAIYQAPLYLALGLLVDAVFRRRGTTARQGQLGARVASCGDRRRWWWCAPPRWVASEQGCWASRSPSRASKARSATRSWNPGREREIASSFRRHSASICGALST